MKRTNMLVLIFILCLGVVSCRPDQAATEYNITEPLVEVGTEDEGGENKDGDQSGDRKLDDYIADCSSAEANGALLEQTYAVNFPAAIECNFNEQGLSVNDLNAEGNGPRINGKVMARKEQFYNVNLPQAATICDIDFQFPQQSMKYDDEIFLTLNDYILMASTNYATNSGSPYYTNGLKVNSLGLMEYNWSGANSLYGLFYSHKVTPKYCLGLNVGDPGYDEKCHIPPTETTGQFKLDIPPEEIIKIGFTNQSTQAKFGFITIGDNDNGDCEHSAYSFDVHVKYINN